MGIEKVILILTIPTIFLLFNLIFTFKIIFGESGEGRDSILYNEYRSFFLKNVLYINANFGHYPPPYPPQVYFKLKSRLKPKIAFTGSFRTGKIVFVSSSDANKIEFLFFFIRKSNTINNGR